MDEVIAELLQNGITEEELARAKRSAIAQAIYSLDNQATLANIVGQALAVGQTSRACRTGRRASRRSRPSEVQAVAQKYLRPEASATGYLEPLEEERS